MIIIIFNLKIIKIIEKLIFSYYIFYLILINIFLIFINNIKINNLNFFKILFQL